jgi:hypothetical protein
MDVETCLLQAGEYSMTFPSYYVLSFPNVFIGIHQEEL